MSENSSTILSNIKNNQKFDDVLSQALEFVASTLNQPEIPYPERLNAALKLLEIGNSSQPKLFNPASLEVTSENGIASDSGFILNPDYVQIDNFLSPEDYEKILNLAIANQEKFFPSEVINDALQYRQSYILLPEHFAEFHELLTNKILTARPTVIQKLKMPMFLVSHLEMQMTAHLHGGYYKIHQDVGAGKATNRKLTYVYYFYQEPKQFYGGDLRLYETQIQNNQSLIQERFTQIEPRNNTIIFFDSRCKHEVLPVYCPHPHFTTGRFTINGWIHG